MPAVPELVTEEGAFRRDLAQLRVQLAALGPLAEAPANAGGRKPYVIAVASHKGGTGRTTTALALSWVWGQAGLKVALVDADPVGACGLVARGPDGDCPWDNVRFFPSLPQTAQGLRDRHLIVLDCPALTEESGRRVLRLADGVVLTCLAEPLTLRTLGSATAAVREARHANGRLRLLGLAVGAFNDLDDLQCRLLTHLRQAGPLLLDPAIPHRPEVCDWPARPGADLPAGTAREAYDSLAWAVAERTGVESLLDSRVY